MSLSSQTASWPNALVLDFGCPLGLSIFDKVTTYDQPESEAASLVGFLGDDAGRRFVVVCLPIRISRSFECTKNLITRVICPFWLIIIAVSSITRPLQIVRLKTT